MNHYKPARKHDFPLQKPPQISPLLPVSATAGHFALVLRTGEPPGVSPLEQGGHTGGIVFKWMVMDYRNMVYIYIHTYLCIYLCIYIYVYLCIYLFVFYLLIGLSICLFSYLFIQLLIIGYIYICIYTHQHHYDMFCELVNSGPNWLK